jgi:RNA polymerase sigma-70 factor (ECF subfamily)
MGKRIVRAKRKIADARIPYEVPTDSELPSRLRSVLRVVYLVFNEGYAASGGPQLVRAGLCAEAVRLGSLLTVLMPDEPEAWALLSLMLLHDARRDARTDTTGAWVPLGEQDPHGWDREALARGRAALARAGRLGVPGEYAVQAAVLDAQIDGVESGVTDWDGIVVLLEALERMNPSAVIKLNLAVAVSFADGPEEGLDLLRPLLAEPALREYQPLHAALADVSRRAGEREAAAAAYTRAIELAGNEVERAELERRLAELSAG